MAWTKPTLREVACGMEINMYEVRALSFRAQILGAAAGGGLPQWNCGCENCNLARQKKIPPQTQSSIAVSASGAWTGLNTSPDIRTQLENTPALHPTGPRELPLANVILTNGDIDHVAGLLVLREQQPFTLFATPEILRILDENPIFNAVNKAVVDRVAIELGQRCFITRVRPLSLTSKANKPLALSLAQAMRPYTTFPAARG